MPGPTGAAGPSWWRFPGAAGATAQVVVVAQEGHAVAEYEAVVARAVDAAGNGQQVGAVTDPHSFAQRDLGDERHPTGRLALSPHGTVHLVASAVSSGVLGIQWEWS